MKPFYQNETDIPDNLKGAYEAKNGRYELLKLSDEHPVVKHNETLVREKGEVETKLSNLTATVGNLERERDEAKAKTVPHGFRAVKTDVAELGEAVKASGLTKEQFTALKTENDEFKAKAAEDAKTELNREAGKFLGYNETAFAKLAGSLDLTKDSEGKFTVKDGEVTKPLTKEFVEAHADFSEFLDSLKAKPRTKTPFPENEGDGALDEFAEIRKEVEDKQKAQIPADNKSVLAALGAHV